MANITSKTIKEGIKTGYTCQKLGFDNRRPFNLGLNDQKAKNSPFKATEGEYWYKIGGKNVTKAEYNKYQNPVGDGPTKSTNDPDASGRKAEIQAAREKLPKKSTVLTEAQTKVKDQGTKLPKKRPPFKKKDFSPHMMYKKGKKAVKANTYEKHLELKKDGYGHTPFKNKFLNRIQTGLTVAGMTPGFGIIADGLNTATSLGRAGYAKMTGDKEGVKKHLVEGGVNALAMVPGLGQGVAGMKLGKEVIKKGGKELVNQVVQKGATKGVVAGTKKVAKDTVATKNVEKPVVVDSKKNVVATTKKKKNNKTTVDTKKTKFAGKGPLKPKNTKNNKPTFKTGLEGITSKKVA